MTDPARRFVFDTVFDEDGAVVRAPVRRDAKVEDALARGREEGRAEGRAQAMAEIERATADAARALANQTSLILARLAPESESLRADAMAVALAAARAVAGAALRRFPDEAVLQAVDEAARTLRAAPRLCVRLAPELAEPLRARLEAAAADAGFPGRLVVQADAGARPGDVALEWDDGLIAHDREAAFARIDEAAERWLSGAVDGSEP